MRRILITRPRPQIDSFAAGLRAAGFEPISFPVIEIQPLEANADLKQALAGLAVYDWVVFTSVNGVKVVWEQMAKIGLRQFPEKVRVAAIGPKTAGALEAHGIRPSFVPDEFVAEAILPGLGDLHGRRVLLLRAELARNTLPELIRAAGGMTQAVAVYRTMPARVDAEGLSALKAGVDAVVFTSPSTVENFVQIVRRLGLDPLRLPARPKIACIGPITEAAARAEGFDVRIVAQNHTTTGLIAAICQWDAQADELEANHHAERN